MISGKLETSFVSIWERCTSTSQCASSFHAFHLSIFQASPSISLHCIWRFLVSLFRILLFSPPKTTSTLHQEFSADALLLVWKASVCAISQVLYELVKGYLVCYGACLRSSEFGFDVLWGWKKLCWVWGLFREYMAWPYTGG